MSAKKRWPNLTPAERCQELSMRLSQEKRAKKARRNFNASLAQKEADRLARQKEKMAGWQAAAARYEDSVQRGTQ